MKIENYHPFQISVTKGFAGNSHCILVNAGKVYNFYNPLNFRNVKMDAAGQELPRLPLPVANEILARENIAISKIFKKIDSDVNRFVVYLVGSLKPPLEWSPCHFFIPMIDEAWLLFRFYAQKEEETSSELQGFTKNFKPEHIKDQTFNINTFTADFGDSSIFFETSPNIECNTFSLAVIGSGEKVGSDWTVKQFIKNNFPITFFLNINNYDFSNTKLFDVNILEAGTEEEWTKVDLENTTKKRYMDFINPELGIYRGYIQYFTNDNSSPSTSQYKFPLSSYQAKECVQPPSSNFEE